MGEKDEPRSDDRVDPQGTAADDTDETTEADAGLAGGTGAVAGEATAQPYGTLDEDE